MKRILVTGGSGFIGSNFIRYMLWKYPKYEIINLDKLTYAGNKENLHDVVADPRYTFIHGDVADERCVDAAVQGVDCVINYAAETHVDRSIVNPRDFVVTDVIGTYTLLEAVRKHKIPRYIQVSTDEVYGSVMDGESAEGAAFDPSSPYSASKSGGDLLCRAYWRTYHVPVILTHSCNVFGPYQYPEKMIPLFITNLLQGKKVPLYGDGMNVREWMYVEDHCRAIDCILHNSAVGEVFNIGTGERFTNDAVVRMILKGMNMGIDMIEHVEDRPGHDMRYALDSRKIREVLLWKPEYKFKEAIMKTIEWYQEHRTWWDKRGRYIEGVRSKILDYGFVDNGVFDNV